jgi:hypothetical protein
MRTFQRIVVFVGVVMLPATVFARATITGTARDPSGAVLPDVTVEAASPVLIEKVRTGVTDGAGIFQIRELRPGIYSVTFTLQGFSAVRRQGVELSGNAVTQLNVELRVTTVEETITLTGEAPSRRWCCLPSPSRRRPGPRDEPQCQSWPETRASVCGGDADHDPAGTVRKNRVNSF